MLNFFRPDDNDIVIKIWRLIIWCFWETDWTETLSAPLCRGGQVALKIKMNTRNVYYWNSPGDLVFVNTNICCSVPAETDQNNMATAYLLPVPIRLKFKTHTHTRANLTGHLIFDRGLKMQVYSSIIFNLSNKMTFILRQANQITKGKYAFW